MSDADLRALERAALAFDVDALERLLVEAERAEDVRALWRVDHLAYLLYLRVVGRQPTDEEQRGKVIWPREASRYAYESYAESGKRWRRLFEISQEADRARERVSKASELVRRRCLVPGCAEPPVTGWRTGACRRHQSDPEVWA